jgi:hypothetical protein
VLARDCRLLFALFGSAPHKLALVRRTASHVERKFEKSQRFLDSARVGVM